MKTGGRRSREGRAILLGLVVVAGTLALAVPGNAAFISIDPISDKYVGDLFAITAMTDLPAGTEVYFSVYSSSFQPTQKTQTGGGWGMSGTAGVEAGGGNTNTISFEVDSSALLPDRYDVTIMFVPLIQSAYVQGTTGTASFYLLEPPTASPPTMNYAISLDPISDKYVGDSFTITAETNLPVGDEVLFTVYSSSYQPTLKTQVKEFEGVAGTAKVMAGTGGMNTLWFDVDTSTFNPDRYIVTAESIMQGTTGMTSFGLFEPTTQTTRPPIQTTTPVPVTTTIPNPPWPLDPFLAGAAGVGVAAIAVIAIRGGGVLGGKTMAGEGPGKGSGPDVELGVRQGIEAPGMPAGELDIRLDVETGIEQFGEDRKGGG